MPILATSLSVGTHQTVSIGGVSFNLDTIIATLVAGFILLAVGFYLRHVVTAGVPGRLQTAMELVWSTLDDYVKQMVGPFARWMIPLLFTLFFFIMVGNWLELIPTGDRLVSPTADTNLTFGLAFTVIILVHVTSVRRLGWRGYLRTNYLHPPGLPRFMYLLLTPINVIAQISYPISLSLRLFGNMFAAALMLQIIALLPIYMGWVLNGVWKLFEGLFVDIVQAFIFVLLTIIYMSMATTTEHGEEAAMSEATQPSAAVAVPTAG